MIITKIRLQEENPMVGETDSWPLPFVDLYLNSFAGENGYLIKTSTGLEPPDLNEIVEGFDVFGTPAFADVSEDRLIVLKIELQPGSGQTYSSLRDELYTFISRTVLISLMDDSIVRAKAIGHIRRVEALHFSNKPEVQITIQCAEGEFFGPESIPIPFASLNSDHPIINYQEGTAPTGLDLVFSVTDPVSEFNIFNHDRVHSSSVTPIFNLFKVTFNFLIGDVITLSTHSKNKRLTMVRSSATYDLAGYVNAGAVWPRLYPRVNSFEWDFASSWMDWESASYIPRFWGV